MTMTKPTSEQVTFTAAGSGATLRNLVDKVREVVSAADFGATGDGVTNDTVALKAAFDYAIPLGRVVVLRGNYLVSGPITTSSTFSSGDLLIECDGPVSITVSGASTAFFALFEFRTQAAHAVCISGGPLLIELNQRTACGFYCRYSSRQDGGTIAITAQVTVRNAFAQSTVIQVAAGFAALGGDTAPYGYGYSSVLIDGMRVESVGRASDGVSRGILVGGYTGETCIRNCYVSNVSRGGVSPTTDADCIFVSGQLRDVANPFEQSRMGSSVIADCTFIDCVGRSVKSQCSQSSVVRPRIFRKNVVTETSADIDFQCGNGRVTDGHFQYELNGSTSPLSPFFRSVTFRATIADISSASSCVNCAVVSEASGFTFSSFVCSAQQQDASVVVSNISFIPTGALVGTSTGILAGGAILLINLTGLVSSGKRCNAIVRNCFGQFGSSAIGYSDYSGGAIAPLFRAEAVGNTSTVSGTTSYCLQRLGGPNTIDALDSFLFRDNHNVSPLLSNVGGQLMKSIDLTKIEVGNSIVLDLDSMASGGGTLTGAPPWDTSAGATATVEVLGQGLASLLNSKLIRVVNTTTPSGTPKRSQVFVSADNASTWIREDDASPVTVTGDSTVGAWESAVINNKSGSACVLTLPSPSLNVGRRIIVKTIQAQAVDSASSNVVPLAGGSAGTSIVTGTAGKFAELVSDGTNWIIMSAN